MGSVPNNGSIKAPDTEKILLKFRIAHTDWWAKKTRISYGLNHVAKHLWHQTVDLIGP